MTHPKSEETDERRRSIARGVVHAIDDTGGDQVVSLETHAGNVRTQVPVHYPFGFAAHCPADGAWTVVHAMAGDAGDPVAMPPANPQAARFGALPEGDAVLYDAAGQRVHLRGGVIVDVQALQAMNVTIGGTLMLEVTGQGAVLHANLVVHGQIQADQDVIAGGGISLQQHVHGGVQNGSSLTGAPQG